MDLNRTLRIALNLSEFEHPFAFKKNNTKAQRRKKSRRRIYAEAIHLLQPWGWAKKEVTLIPSCEAKRLRKHFSYQVRREFLADLLDALRQNDNINMAYIARWPIHHIIPLSLGGNNDQLALCDPVWHDVIHTVINGQTNSMVMGETRVIHVPYIASPLWSFINSPLNKAAEPLIKKTVQHCAQTQHPHHPLWHPRQDRAEMSPQTP